jgi:hypothetical protein
VNARSALARQQSTFMDLLLDDSLPMPTGWDAERVAVYRNAYRNRLVDAIRDTYPRTERWVGEAAFRRAAIHHVIRHPPRSWTLDAVGEGFDATLAGLFAGDPEVAELAWVEWAMHSCFVAADGPAIDAPAFSTRTAGYTEDDWAAMQLRFVPDTQVRPVHHAIDRLWAQLADASDAAGLSGDILAAAQPRGCVVWRQGLSPVFCLVDAAESSLLRLLLDGASYGSACATLAEEVGSDAAVTQAGAMLGRWIHQGLLAGVARG